MFLAFYWAVSRHWDCLYWRQSADVQGPVAGQHPSNHACIVFDEIPTSSLDLPPTQRSCGRLVLVSCDKAPTISITHSFHTLTCRIQYDSPKLPTHRTYRTYRTYEHLIIRRTRKPNFGCTRAQPRNTRRHDRQIDIIEFVSDKCRLKTLHWQNRCNPQHQSILFYCSESHCLGLAAANMRPNHL